MTIMHDGAIRNAVESGWLGIDPPLADRDFQPNSFHVYLGSGYQEKTAQGYGEPFHVDALAVPPGACFLGHTIAWFKVPANLVLRVAGVSSVAREFISVTLGEAGHVDSGFEGQITLEIKNHSPKTFELWTGMRIAQVIVELTTGSAERPYGHPDLGSHYQHQRSATPNKDSGLFRERL